MRKSEIAIVADWIYGGGAEKVILELHHMFPEAPIYTSYCSDEWRKKLGNKVVTGYLQKSLFRQLRKFLPVLRQHWFSRLDLSQFDLVISTTGNGEAKFVKVPNGKHISYCFTPVHYYWRHYQSYMDNPGFRPKFLARLGLKLLIRPLRQRDYRAAQSVDKFIAISSHIQNDIKKFYGKDSVVIHPPVDTERFSNTAQASRSGFVTMGRQVPMKRTDLIIQACNQLKLPLTVIGRGSEHKQLVSIAGPTITFKTNVSDKQMPSELASGQAFIFASFEDFGIAPIEAMATGTPVIAYRAGGSLDYVKPGETGEFFEEQTVNSIENSLREFDLSNYRQDTIKQSVEKFSIDNFCKNIAKVL